VSLVPWLVRQTLTEEERSAVVRVCGLWIAQIDSAQGPSAKKAA
jgi:hypothetical protein